MAHGTKGANGPVGPGPGSQPGGFQKPKNASKTMGRLLQYLGRNRILLFFVILLLVLSSACTLGSSYMLQPLIDNYIVPKDFKGLAYGILLLVLIYLGGTLFSFLQSKLMVNVAQKTANRIRRDLFNHMQSLPLKVFDSKTHGELMSRFTNDVDNIQTMLEQSIVQLFSSALMFVGIICVMLYLSPILFLVTLVCLGLMIFLSTSIGKKSRTNFQQQQQSLGEMNGYIEETIEGMRVVKVFNHEEDCREAFQTLNGEFQESATKANYYAGVIMPVMGNLNNISYALTAVFGGILAIVGGFSLGSLAAFLQYSRQVGQPINQITNQMNAVFSALAGAERVFQLMDTKSETDEGEVTLECEGSGHTRTYFWRDGGTRIPLRGDVHFEDVTFSYDGEKDVLRQVSLFAKPGQKIAFVGSTGAGKTTITNLVNRFYDVQKGVITYDGIDVKRIKKADLRRTMGIVLQDTHLFTGTVLENIRYGRLDATDEECIAAAKRASAHSFIHRLPGGYDTRIDGDGGNLSQGQRQLLAIARAAVADPPVLILDEATSSIDTRTERLIEQGMDALMEGRTVFVIAHRLSTVRNADVILVMEHGQVIERGSHEELLKKQGRYYELSTGMAKLS